MTLSRNLVNARTAAARSILSSGYLFPHSQLGSRQNIRQGCHPSCSRQYRSKRGDPGLYAAEDVPSPRDLAASRQDRPDRAPRPPDAPVLSAHDIDKLALSGNLILAPPYITSYLKRKRSAQSLAQVMPVVEELLAHGFQANPFVLGVLMARDVWRPEAVRELAGVLRVAPNGVNWSQAINNALRLRGLLSALEVLDAAVEEPEGVLPELSAVNNIVRKLIAPSPHYRPDARAIRRAFALYRRVLDSEAWDGDGGRKDMDDSRFEPMHLIVALAGTHAVPSRREDIAYLLDAATHHGVQLGATKSISEAMHWIYRADGFDAAVDAVWNTPGINADAYKDHMALLGRIARLRFNERSSLPFDAFLRYLDNLTRSGDDVQPDAYMILLGSYTAAGIQLQVDEEARTLGAPAAATHLALLRADLAAAEHGIRSTLDAELADVRLRTAVLRAHSAAGAFGAAHALWAGFPGRASPALLGAMLVACRVHKRLDAARAVWASAPPSARDGLACAAWAECLADCGAWDEAVAALDDRDSGVSDTRAAVRVLRSVSPDPVLRRRMLAEMPEIWQDPVVREEYDVSFAQRRERLVAKLLQKMEDKAPRDAR